MLLIPTLSQSNEYEVADSRLYSIEIYKGRQLKWNMEYYNRDKSGGQLIYTVKIIEKLNFDARLFSSIYNISKFFEVDSGEVQRDLFNYLIIPNLLVYSNGSIENYYEAAARGIKYDDEGNYSLTDQIPQYSFLKNFGETLINITVNYDYSSGIANEFYYAEMYQDQMVERYVAIYDNSFNLTDIYNINSILRPNLTRITIGISLIMLVMTLTLIFKHRKKS